MTWWALAIAALLALPLLAVFVGGLLLLFSCFLPEGVFYRECSCCGRTGYWTQRSSLGYHVCDACAGHREKATGRERCGVPDTLRQLGQLRRGEEDIRL